MMFEQGGTYSVNDADKTLITHVEACTFPNWKGTERKVSFSLSGDEFRFSTIS
jgi:Lipocalin-like domain